MDLFKSIVENRIIPTHIQINPTNKCPLDCSFCSVKNRNKNLELSISDLKKLTQEFINLGTKAVTITGGGDPLAYESLGEYLGFLYDQGIKSGLVSNGILFKKSDYSFMNKVTWCRISLSDEYNLLTPKLETVVQNSQTDWSFSYVIKPETRATKVIEAIKFANKNKFTHVRLVDDILNDNPISRIEQLKKEISSNVDDSIVIYQGRKSYTKGHKRCLISLLKPNIGPDGNIFACCGIQYSKKPPSLDLDPKDAMGSINDIGVIWNKQKFYDGSACEVCYYSDYNNILNIIWNANLLMHKEFI